ncbi:MAG: GNAT family N-acetyltransferase, partial [Pseudonocardia sp.]|nr:GNAT family N-acetyltransferase [Pseudonocardia sp.]
AFDHPDAQRLVAALQQHYVRLYGGGDGTPVDPDDFAPPLGRFLVGYVDGVAVACGGWRARDRDAGDPAIADGDAEIKRMYTDPVHRGLGIGRQLLSAVEQDAAAAGRRRAVLETGVRQTDALAFYPAAGYTPIHSFGMYRDHPGSRCFAKSLVGGSRVAPLAETRALGP